MAARNEHKTAAVVSEVEAMGRRGIGVRCDVLQHEDIAATVDTAVRELGGVNILVNKPAWVMAVSRRTPSWWPAG